jgi:tripartite-type tricarboxylate transporter receptor subunit TctC
MEEIKRRAGLSITHVPYKGSVAGLTDVISGNVSMALETASAVRPHIESGRLRGLAVGSASRLSGILAPLPTLIEQGFPDLKAVTWLMMLYPAGTPKAHLQSVHQAIQVIMKQPEVQARMLTIGLQPRLTSSVDETNEYLKSEYHFWAEVVKRSGVPKE